MKTYAFIYDNGTKWNAIICVNGEKQKLNSDNASFGYLTKKIDAYKISKEKILVHSKNKPVHLWSY